MAALNFPSSPSVGQTYPSPAVSGQPVYTWDGEKWVGGTGGGNIYIADSAPAAPVGSLWWESDTGTLYVRYNDGNSIQWVAILGPSTPPAPRKNYIINGAMQVSQENGATAGSMANYYPVDEFLVAASGTTGVGTAAQVASVTPAGSPNRIRCTVTTADAAVAAGDLVNIRARIEGLRVADLQFGSAAAKTLTLRFGAKAPAGTYCVVFMNNANNRSYVAEYVIASGEANADVVKSMTIPGDQSGTWLKDNGLGLEVRWGLMVGSTFQQAAGSWGTGLVVGSANQFNFMGTVGNVFELFDVGLYEGMTAPTFVVPDYPSEQTLCQRYFEKRTGVIGIGHCTSATTSYIGITYPTKRVPPTLANTGTIAVYNVGGSQVNVSATALYSSTPEASLYGANVPSGLVAGSGTELVVVSGQFNLNARL